MHVASSPTLTRPTITTYTAVASVDGFDETREVFSCIRADLGKFVASYRARGFRHLSIQAEKAPIHRISARKAPIWTTLDDALAIARQTYWDAQKPHIHAKAYRDLLDALKIVKTAIHRLVLIAGEATQNNVTIRHATSVIDQRFPILRARIEGTPLERDLL